MTLFRFVSLSAHGAVEALAAPVLMAAPFALGFEPATAIASVIFGVLLLGLALWSQSDEQALPISSHLAFDYGLALGMIGAGLVLAPAVGDLAATLFLTGIGVTHIALTASTRYSHPRRA